MQGQYALQSRAEAVQIGQQQQWNATANLPPHTHTHTHPH